ncbi:MAG: hypothetical protein ACFBSC_14005 [Microcoleaceae cyanobacterium]
MDRKEALNWEGDQAMESALEQQAQRLRLFVYLIPAIGVFPALWTLYRSNGNSQEQAVSRLAITLLSGCLLGQFFLGMGSYTAESFRLPLLLTSSVLTTSYFIICIGLMIRIWQRQSPWLPGISPIAERWVRKYLP